MKKFALITLLLCVSLIPATAEGRKEATYPARPVTLIVPWDTGGGTDTVARALLTVMGNYFPQPMVVVNKPGGGGVVGTTEALMAKPDGYTLVFNSWGAFITQPSLKKIKYSEKDYEPVLRVASVPRILVANPKVPYNTIKEMIDYARNNPGAVKAGIAAVGATDHLAFAQIELDYNVKLNIIPQGGGGPSKVNLLGGHTDVAALTATEGGPLIAAKQLKAFGTMDSERFSQFSDIPTCAEYGIPLESGVEEYLVVPQGTSPEIIQLLQTAFKKSMDDPAFLGIAKKLNIGVKYLDSKAARERLEKFRLQYKDLIDKLGIGEK